ncbi:IS21-like element helper ATPase IstB [Alteromonas alba]|nr:IS21-like element helper ATPase IstB [Alteromonas alba]
MINPIPELTPLLKQLRLSGMTDSLAMRNREAIEHQLSYPDFLALLVQDEVARRDQKKYATRLRRAGFRGNKTLESFDLNANPNLNRAYINELADCRFIDEYVAVLIAGPCGTGKSHLAQAIGHCAVQQGIDVLFFTQAKLLANLHAARATNTYEKRFQTLAKVDLLIIDDFGLKPLKSPQDEDLHDLIDERYEQKSTIITSNLDFSEWGQAFPNKLLGAATLDRLRHNAYRLVLEGESYRKLREHNDQTGRGGKSEK